MISDTMNAPQGYAHLVSQLRRAATSVPLNIAEGYGRYNPKEKGRFYRIARGSCYECVAAVEICHRCSVLDDKARTIIRDELDATGRMLTGLIRSGEPGENRHRA
ncbi:MAG: four helix bundle protein [Planctomycetes bacterium]|nr:four helix bundle protein [Planctomycetota bacterium]